MASLLTVAAFFVAASLASLASEASSAAAVMYTTGGQGFHRQLLLHVPITAPAENKQEQTPAATSTFSLTVNLRLRNTFFIDVAEAEGQWDSRLLVAHSSSSKDVGAHLAQQFPFAASRPTASTAPRSSFIRSIDLRHPIQTLYPFDIEIPTAKSPYLFNEANVTFDIVVRNTASAAAETVVAVLSFPIHERYEDVTTDASVTHIRRCIEAHDVKLLVNKVEKKAKTASSASLAKTVTNAYTAPLEGLAIKFSQSENTTAILSAVGLDATTPSATAILTADNTFCVEVPVGFLGDLPIFYWSTMSMMVLGAVAVWLGLTFV